MISTNKPAPTAPHGTPNNMHPNLSHLGLRPPGRHLTNLSHLRNILRLPLRETRHHVQHEPDLVKPALRARNRGL